MSGREKKKTQTEEKEKCLEKIRVGRQKRPRIQDPGSRSRRNQSSREGFLLCAKAEQGSKAQEKLQKGDLTKVDRVRQRGHRQVANLSVAVSLPTV